MTQEELQEHQTLLHILLSKERELTGEEKDRLSELRIKKVRSELSEKPNISKVEIDGVKYTQLKTLDGMNYLLRDFPEFKEQKEDDETENDNLPPL